MPRSPSPSTADELVDELVEQGHRRVNESVVRMFTRALERNPGADLGDVLQMALRKYPLLRRQVEERSLKRQRKGMYQLVANFTDAFAWLTQLLPKMYFRETR